MNIKDIAKLAGVSTSTISKVLNNKDGDISDETRKKVLDIIKEYQYVPFSKVRQNLPLKSHLLGLLITETIDGIEQIIYGVEHQAAEEGYSIIVCNCENDVKKQEKHMSILLSKNVEGILQVGEMNLEATAPIVPVITVGCHSKSQSDNTNGHFYYDLKDVGMLATEYLIHHGHRRIGCLLLEEDERIEKGYIKALQESNILIDPIRVYKGKNEKEIGTLGVASCQKMDITALICGNTRIAYCVYKVLRERGVVIPDEVSVLTLRDDTMAEILGNGTTSIHIPNYQLGEMAVESLIRVIETKKMDYKQTKLPVEIMERHSVVAPPNNRQSEKIVVVGSMNMDVTISVPSIPTDGETSMATSVSLIPGGKGANQAVGAGKLGGLVYAIGRLGNDSDGKDIYNSLIKNNVKTEGVIFETSLASGKAYINVAKDGESNIVVYSGANQNLDKNQIRQFKHLFEHARYCLLSLEIPQDTAQYVIHICKKMGVGVILKPSGANELQPELLGNLEYFIPNAKELKQLLPEDGSLEEKAERLLKMGVQNVIVTLGRKGCYLKNEKYERYFPSADFTAVDTTGGADSFISALAVYLSEGHNILHAIRFATYAAGLSITRAGVQPALPDRVALDVYQDDINSYIE